MKINSNSLYINLILRALETTIVPELGSATARAVADIIRLALVELQKRCGPASRVVSRSIAEGIELETNLIDHLGLRSPDTSSILPRAEDSFDALVTKHAALTERISVLSSQVADARRDLGQPGGGPDEAILLRVAQWEMAYYTQQAAATPNPPTGPLQENTENLTREFLQTFLNEKEPHSSPAKVTSFLPVLGGYGKQTFLCRIGHVEPARETELIVRKTDPCPPMTYGFATLEEEYHLLRCLAKTGYPSPRPEHFCRRRGGLNGSFYTMPRIPGKVAGSFLGGLDTGHTERFFLDLAELMARLHSTPMQVYAEYLQTRGDARFLEATVEEAYRINLIHWRKYLAEVEHLPSPYLSWLFDWLEHHVPRDGRPAVLVHGDFNIHNMLADEGRITGVLDWECAGFGAPEQDLAYLRPYIDKQIDWTVFLDHYKTSGGPPLALDAELLKFCQVYSAVRTNLGGNRCVFNLQSGALQDIRYAMVELGLTEAFMKIGLNA